jgi:hypothetical protein
MIAATSMNRPLRRSLGWLLLAALALICLWNLRPPPLAPEAADSLPALISTVAELPARAANPPANTDATWNRWRAQLPVAKPAIEDVTEWPANRAEVFDKFRSWQAQYRTAADKAALEAEGVAMAKTRRVAMAKWIERDPEFALAQAVGPDARRELPAAVLAELERWVEGLGGLEVQVRCGPQVKTGERLVRKVRVNGENFDAFVYGRRLGQATKYDLPIHAVAVDGKLALHVSPVRQLEAGEVRERGLAAAGIHLHTGGEVLLAVHAQDAFAIETKLLQREAGRGPYPAAGLKAGQLPAGLPPGTAAFPPTPGHTLGLKRILIIRVDFSDDPGGPFDRNSGQTITSSAISTVMAQTDQFYRDNSQNQTSLQTTILPVVLRLPQTKAAYGGLDPMDDLRQDALTAARTYDQQNGNTGQFNPDLYDFDISVFSDVPGFSFGGLAFVGAKGQLINAEFSLRLLGHELGHNYGLQHANRWEVPGTDPIDANGSSVEYGDAFDMMGDNFPDRAIHFNEWYKAYLGWLNATNWQTASTSGTYRLFRHDHVSVTGVRGITAGQTNDRAYWLGFRRNLTTYNTAATNFLANGVEIRWGMQAPGITNDMSQNGSRLLNFTPAVTNFTRHPLPIGQTFTDTNFDLSITPLSVGGIAPNEFIDLNISYSTPPATITQPPTNQTVNAGSTVTFDVVATGAAPITYQWVFNNVNIPGATSSNLTLTSVTTNQSGTYFVRVTNPGGTVNSQTATLTVNPVVGPVVGPFTNGSFELPAIGANIVITNGATNIIGWTVGGTGPVSFVTGPSFAVSPLNGTQMVEFNAADSVPGDTLAQTFLTTPGQTYTVSFNVAKTPANAPGTMSVQGTVTSGTGATLGSVNGVAPASGWSAPQVFTFVATTANSTLTFLDTSLATVAVDALLDNVTVTVGGAPVVTVPPQDLTVQAGATANFSVTASGSPPLTYQWLFNGTNLPGATSSSLTLVNVQGANAGSYSVQVSNGSGSTTSAAATLTVITLTPVAHWKFDEPPGGTIAVDSRSNFNGALSVSGAGFVAGGRAGNALSLSRISNGYVDMGNVLSLTNGNYSIVAWVKTAPGDVTDNLMVIAKHTPGVRNGYFVQVNTTGGSLTPGKAHLVTGGSGVVSPATFETPTSTTSVNDGAWHQIVAVHDTVAGLKRIYVDGSPMEDAKPVQTVTPNNSAPLLIGGVFNGLANLGLFDGLLDDIQIYNRPLNDGEIDYLFQNPGQEITGAPIITAQPQSTSVVLGGTAAFSVTNDGIGPFTYQWRFNGANLPGATGPALTLNNVQTNQAGSYSVRIDSALGFTTSTNALLTVLTPPFVLTHPTNRTVLAGSNVTFTVTAGGTAPLSYQWRFNGTNLPGATAPSLLVPNSQFINAGTYSVLVGNPYGAATSSNAVLTVNSAPVIIAQPANQVASVAAPATFNVGVAGTAPFSYQWRFNGSAIPGATNAAYSLSGVVGAHAGQYSVVLTNLYGVVTSTNASLTTIPVRVYSPWGTTAGGTESDVGKAVAVDVNGNAFVAGFYTGTAAFGTNALTSAGARDGFLAKYSSAGQLLWLRSFGGVGFDSVNAVAVDTNGNCYLVGSYEGVAAFGSVTLTNTSASSFADVFIAKFNPGGTNVWARSLGVASSHDLGNAVALDGAGNIFVAGQSTLGSFNGVTLTNHGRAFLAKYDNAGNPQWARKAGGGPTGQFDEATGLAADAAGNVYLAGVFATATASFDGGFALANRGGFDSFLARYDVNGGAQWAQQMGGTLDDRANGVAVDAAGNAYVAGEFTGAVQLPGTNLATSPSDQNMFIARFDPAGAVNWARQAGGTLPDSARAVTVRGNEVFITGFFSGAVTFGPDTVVSVGNTFDAFLARLDTNGAFAFAQQAGGSDLGGDFGLALAVDATGSALLAGYYSGASALGSTTANSTGGEDVFLTRFNAFAGDAPPPLNFLPVSGQLRLSWPLGASSYILQTAPDLRPQSWTDALGVLGVESSEFAMTNQVPVTNRFFRLRKP